MWNCKRKRTFTLKTTIKNVEVNVYIVGVSNKKNECKKLTKKIEQKNKFLKLLEKKYAITINIIMMRIAIRSSMNKTIMKVTESRQM